jgi:hypothetical protein
MAVLHSFVGFAADLDDIPAAFGVYDKTCVLQLDLMADLEEVDG